jgi:hypothetical protein
MKYLRNPKRAAIFYIGAILILFILGPKNKLNGQNIYVDPDMLQWTNYKGKMDFLSAFTAFTKSNIKVILGTSISYNPSDPPKIEVAFMQDSSWVNYFKLNQLSPRLQTYLLNHEKIHYLITIIEAKKLKKEISDKKINNIQELFTSFNNHSQMMNERNELYDAETNHSGNVLAQNRWEIETVKELNDLKSIILDQQ